MSISIVLLFAISFAFMLICQLYTLLFIILGVPKDKAKFQAISILTNTGFTTKHAEIIMQSKKRRDVATSAMLVGFFFSVCFVSLLINIVVNINTIKSNGSIFEITLISAGVFIGLYIFSKLPFVKKFFYKVFSKLANRIVYGHKKGNLMLVIEYIKNYVVAEININEIPECLIGKNIEEAKLPATYGLQVLAIHKKTTNKIISNIATTDIIEQGDIVTIYGDEKTIKNLFSIVKIS